MRAIMINWFADYHHILLLRLLGLAVVFGVILPSLWLLLAIGFRSTRRLGRHIWHGRPTWQGDTP